MRPYKHVSEVAGAFEKRGRREPLEVTLMEELMVKADKDYTSELV